MKNSNTIVKPSWYQPSLIPEDEWITMTIRVHVIGRTRVQAAWDVVDAWRDEVLGAEVGSPRRLTMPEHVSSHVSALVTDFLMAYTDPF